MQKIYRPAPQPTPNTTPNPPSKIRPQPIDIGRPIRPPIFGKPTPPIHKPPYTPYELPKPPFFTGGSLRDYLDRGFALGRVGEISNGNKVNDPYYMPEGPMNRPQDVNLQMSNLEQEPEQNRFNALRNLLIK